MARGLARLCLITQLHKNPGTGLVSSVSCLCTHSSGITTLQERHLAVIPKQKTQGDRCEWG